MAYSRVEQAYIDAVADYQFPDPVIEEPAQEQPMMLADSGKVKSDAQPGFGTIGPIPRNKAQEALGYVGELLTKAGVQLDKVGLDIPMLGRITLKDLTVGESGRVLEDMSYGFMPVEGAGGFISGTTRIKPDEALELLNLAPAVGVAAKAAVKGGEKAVKTLAPKAAEMAEDYMVKQGFMLKLTPDSKPVKVEPAPQIETPQFSNWFGSSKVVDEVGKPIVVYHGTGRPDRIDAQFRKSRATSGPMAFFTDDAEIASSYAKGKTDTSLTYENNAYDYINWFKKKEGRSTLNLEQVGARMSQAERQAVTEKLRDIRMTDDGEIIYEKGGGSIMDSKAFDYYLNTESKGNPLVAANKIFLESGTLYDQEEKFAKVLNLMGVKGFDMKSPHDRMPAVYPVYLSIKNPLDTSAIPENVVTALESASAKVRKPTQRSGADNWDKNTVSPQDWIARLKSDIETGTTHAWTSIPDWVTKTLKTQGYDGIKDVGGKSGGVTHSVWIPFEESQVKSATGNRGTFDPNSKNILRGVAVGGGGGGGAVATQEENK